MMRPRLLAPLLVSPVVLACGDDPPPPAAEDTAVELVHLVGDAGATGTRFCVFLTRGETTPAGATCSEPREFRIFRDRDRATHCISKSSFDVGSAALAATATGGLQDLVDDPDKAREMVEQALDEIDQALSGRGKVLTAAAILGTSGFRDGSGRAIGRAYDGLWRTVASAFEERQIPVTTRVLRLEEEARFSWMTIRFLRLQNRAFSILETGAGGCHFATAESDAEYDDVISASDPIGTARAWQAYAATDIRQEEIPELKEPAFRPCYSGSPADATGQDARACVAFLRARVFDAASLARAARAVAAAGRPLYGMGPAWNGMFTTYFPGKASVTADDIAAAAAAECSRPQREGRGFIKHQSCFALAFQEAFLRTVTGPDGGVVRNGVESWPRGASVSPGGEFPACKDSTIRVSIDPDPEPNR